VTAQGGGTTASTSAAETHDRMVAAYHAQRERLWPNDDMWAGAASNFKPDFSAPLNEVQKFVASHLRESDTLLDVGGGAGRMSLPLASRCREVVCVDPSAGMAEIFRAVVQEQGVKNARFVHSGWLEADDIHGDVALVSHVTYFVPQIEPFVSRLNAATRRRVIIATRSVPPPNQLAPFVELATGEKQALVPGADHVMAVLKEMSFAAELVDLGEAMMPATMPIGKTSDDAIKLQAEGGVRLGWLRQDDVERFASLVRSRFDELFALVGDGYRPRSSLGARDLVITWETSR
jgi:2-polyprenyl-3-methyl-5-hydroxy-6-metoxy-1,4-benzoquinol methylase